MNGDFKPDETTTVRLPRVAVDFKIPAWGLAIAAASGIALIGNMWFTLNTVKDAVSDMANKLTIVIAANQKLASEQDLMKYRLDKLESARGGK